MTRDGTTLGGPVPSSSFARQASTLVRDVPSSAAISPVVALYMHRPACCAALSCLTRRNHLAREGC